MDKLEARLIFDRWGTLEDIVLMSKNEEEQKILEKALCRVVTSRQWKSRFGLFHEEPDS